MTFDISPFRRTWRRPASIVQPRDTLATRALCLSHEQEVLEIAYFCLKDPKKQRHAPLADRRMGGRTLKLSSEAEGETGVTMTRGVLFWPLR